MTDQDYELHITNYILNGFKHLLTDVERYALFKSITFDIVHEDGCCEENVVATSVEGEFLKAKIESLLSDGMPSFRAKTARRILKDHEAEVLQNQCSQCHKLPRTHKAKQCHWCGHTWREGNNDGC